MTTLPQTSMSFWSSNCRRQKIPSDVEIWRTDLAKISRLMSPEGLHVVHVDYMSVFVIMSVRE